MVQTLKPERRERLLSAAEVVFARAGYAGATVAEIARTAGVSTANLYLYFENKDALFYSVFNDAFADEFMALLRKRVAALARSDELTALDAAARAHGEELLQFWIVHRLKVVTILDRAAGSRYEGFRARFVDELVRLSINKLRADRAGKRLAAHERFVLERIFENTVTAIVSILEAYSDPATIRAAIAGFWSYQLAGLTGFASWVRNAVP
jgi:AcrR family transcriptional regulator